MCFSYNPPNEDDSQDIKVLEIGKKDNVTYMKFLKKFSSDDKEVSKKLFSLFLVSIIFSTIAYLNLTAFHDILERLDSEREYEDALRGAVVGKIKINYFIN